MCETTPAVRRELPLSALAPASARQLAQEARCPAHGAEADAAVTLLTSELVTDAMLHGAPPLRLTLECRVTEVRIAVDDAATTTPEVVSPHRDLAMLLIDKIAREWAVDVTDRGTTRWCLVPTGTAPDVRRPMVGALTESPRHTPGRRFALR